MTDTHFQTVGRCCETEPTCDIFSVTEADTSKFETVGIWTAVKTELPANLFAIDISSRYIPVDGEMEYALLDDNDAVVVKWKCGYSVAYNPGDINTPAFYHHKTLGSVTWDGDTKTVESGEKRDHTQTLWDTGHQFAARPDTSLLFDTENPAASATLRRWVNDFDLNYIPEELVGDWYQSTRGFAIPIRDIASQGPLRFAYRFIQGATSPSGLFAHTFIATWLRQEGIDTSESEGLPGDGDASDASGGCEDQEELNSDCTDIRPNPVTNPFYLMPRHIVSMDADVYDGSTVVGTHRLMGDPPDFRRTLAYQSQPSGAAQLSQRIQQPSGTPSQQDVFDEFLFDFNGDATNYNSVRDASNYSIVNSTISAWGISSLVDAEWDFLATSDPCVWSLYFYATITCPSIYSSELLGSGVSRDRDLTLKFRVYENPIGVGPTYLVSVGENAIPIDQTNPNPTHSINNYNAIVAGTSRGPVAYGFEKPVYAWDGTPPTIEDKGEYAGSQLQTSNPAWIQHRAVYADWQYEFDSFSTETGGSYVDLLITWKRKTVEISSQSIRTILRPDDTGNLWHP